MLADMNDSIARINARLLNLNFQKREGLGALSEWVHENPPNAVTIDRHGRNLTRFIRQIEAKINILEELKAEFETVVEYEERPDEIPTR